MDNIQPELLGLDLFWLYPGVVHSVLCIPTVLVRVPGLARVLKLWPSRPRGHDFGVPKWRSNYVWKSTGTLTWWLKTVLPFQERKTWMLFDSTRESPMISVGSRCFIFSPSAVPAVRPGRVPGWFRIRAPAASMWWRPLPPCWCWGRLRRSSTRSAARSKGCGARRLELLRCLKVLSYVIILCYRYLTLFNYTESLWMILKHIEPQMTQDASAWRPAVPPGESMKVLRRSRLSYSSRAKVNCCWGAIGAQRLGHVAPSTSALGRCLSSANSCCLAYVFFSQNPKGGRNPAFCANTRLSRGYINSGIGRVESQLQFCWTLCCGLEILVGRPPRLRYILALMVMVASAHLILSRQNPIEPLWMTYYVFMTLNFDNMQRGHTGAKFGLVLEDP